MNYLGISDQDLSALHLSFKLALTTSVLLILISIPLTYLVLTAKSYRRTIVEALSLLPLVLPPAVIGFYILLLLSDASPIGQLLAKFGVKSLAFSFKGMVLGSVIFSFPMVFQTIQMDFNSVDQKQCESAYLLGASQVKAFITILLPQCLNSIITALLLGFCHTFGEFGVVLIIGGNMPGITKVLSIQLYEKIETYDFAGAHRLSAIYLLAALVALFLIFYIKKTYFFRKF